VDNIELENTIKYNLSTDRLNSLTSGSSIGNLRTQPSSGYIAALQISKSMGSTSALAAGSSIQSSSVNSNRNSMNAYKPRDSSRNLVRVNRMKVNEEMLPKVEELKSARQKKRLLAQSVELFNSSPSKGIQFLKDNNIFSSEPNAYMQQLIKYLKETPTLDKKMIGEYLSSRKHTAILEEFVKSFNFKNLRIDEALRSFLETFRLPGEAPLISNIMENFAKHWRSSNNNQFADTDAAYTLAYAIIMLNVDQHNHNVKKQSIPMTVDDFKKNLSRTNGKGNFDDELLEEIYLAIKTEEIIMPAEHTGALRDNYLWKVLIRRGRTNDANYIHAPTGSYNHEIFSIVWAQTISALSFVYDKSFELTVVQKTINGFR
jgi:golgi-specific brefeldin A-resistance guanine nucleotide exchange factor 1